MLQLLCHKAKTCQLEIRQVFHYMFGPLVLSYQVSLKHVVNEKVTNVFSNPIQVDWFPREPTEATKFLFLS